jgi:hypothetical protein
MQSQNKNIKYREKLCRSHFCSGKYRICEVNIYLFMPNNFEWKTLIHLCEGTLMRKVFRTEAATCYRRKIRIIEGNAKCRHQKKFACKGTLRQAFVCLRPRTQTPPPTVLYLFTQGRREGERGGRLEPERRGEGQQFTKLGRKYRHD